MKTYLAYQNQIGGLRDVSETVKAIEKIAASSVHFLKENAANLDFYAARIKKQLDRLSLFYAGKNHPALKKSPGKKALIVITGDKGLVGGLWHKIINAFLETAGEYQYVISVGKKGSEYLVEENAPVIKSFDRVSGASQDQSVREIIDFIFNEFGRGRFSAADVLYPEFVSLAQQEPVFSPSCLFNLSRRK